MKIYRPENQPGLPAGDQPWDALLDACEGLNDEFINTLNDGGGAVNDFETLPQELHPYLHYRAQMVERPRLYIIGTFPPASYLVNQLGVPVTVNGAMVAEGPAMNFFHGNVNALWNVMPGFPDDPPTVQACLDFLEQHNAVYSDIIFSCGRTGIDATADIAIRNILVNNPLLVEVSGRDNKPCLWFTSSGVFNQGGINVHVNNGAHANHVPGNVNVQGAQAYNLFLRALQDEGWSLAVRDVGDEDWIQIVPANADVLAAFNYRLVHELQLRQNGVTLEYRVLTGPSPAGQAAMQMGGNPNYQAWVNDVHGGVPPQPPTPHFRTYVYSSFLNDCGESLLGL